MSTEQKLITLFEYQSAAYTEIGLSPNDPDIQALARFCAAARKETREQALLALELDRVKATQFVGILRAGHTTFQILPKIDARGNAEAAPGSEEFQQAITSAQNNLMFMLTYAFDLKAEAQEIANLANQRLDWFELLTRLFAQELHRQVQMGLQHSYVIQEETLPVLRGRWDIGRQVRRNPQTWFPFETIYDEFSADHPLNRLFRFVTRQLLPQTKDRINHRLLLDLDAWLEGAALLQGNPASLLQPIHFTRLNERFQPAYNLARLFLSGYAPQFSGGQDQVFAFVFDMNVLYERFMARFLQRHRQAIFPPGWQNAQISAQYTATDAHLAAWADTGERWLRLRPDIAFLLPDWSEPFLILDTKYKVLDEQRRDLGINDSDVYQMLAYAERFHCPRIMLLYPQASAHGGPIRRQINLQIISPVHIWVQTTNLRCASNLREILISEMRQIFAQFTNNLAKE